MDRARGRGVEGGIRGPGADGSTARLWWGVLLGSALSLSAFWGPMGLALWWWLHR